MWARQSLVSVTCMQHVKRKLGLWYIFTLVQLARLMWMWTACWGENKVTAVSSQHYKTGLDGIKLNSYVATPTFISYHNIAIMVLIYNSFSTSESALTHMSFDFVLNKYEPKVRTHKECQEMPFYIYTGIFLTIHRSCVLIYHFIDVLIFTILTGEISQRGFQTLRVIFVYE